MQEEVEALTRPDVRERLPLRRLVRLYLDPFALFKNVSVGPPRARAAGTVPLGALARAEPLLGLPFLGLELGFSFAVCVLLLAGAVYVLLGLDEMD